MLILPADHPNAGLDLAHAGTSPAAIARHYDLSDDFFASWLGPDLVYSCALWDADKSDSLAVAQWRKLDFFREELHVAGGRILDVGCGWGALLDRFVRSHSAHEGVGLTLSSAQQQLAAARGASEVDYRVESWVDHVPDAPYDAITCIEATEHFASDALDPDAKVDVYRAFFARCASWLRDDGRLGLQLICLDNVGHVGSRPRRGPLSELLRTDIFPESMPASLSELVLGWETDFRLATFLDHTDHYRRTFRAWGLAARRAAQTSVDLVGPQTARMFARYFAAGEVIFRLREHALYRVVLIRRAAPKSFVMDLYPSQLTDPAFVGPPVAVSGASPAAIQAHYDVSNDFYRLWLDATMMYSSGWGDIQAAEDLEAAATRKIDFFAHHVQAPQAMVLDIGCGWGGNLRRLVEHHDAAGGVGLTLSEAQHDFLRAAPIRGVEVRLEGWEEHQPAHQFDAIVSYGAFEHFARDGSSGVERVETYRRFFARCFEWLRPGGRLGLETIGHDDAPDTASALGRGPLGDAVLQLFPESISPHLRELVLGFEPWFEVKLLRSDSADFAATFRAWLLRLREREAEAVAVVGEDTVRRYRRYLAASEVQFRLGVLTNYRVILHRRPALKR